MPCGVGHHDCPQSSIFTSVGNVLSPIAMCTPCVKGNFVKHLLPVVNNIVWYTRYHLTFNTIMRACPLYHHLDLSIIPSSGPVRYTIIWACPLYHLSLSIYHYVGLSIIPSSGPIHYTIIWASPLNHHLGLSIYHYEGLSIAHKLGVLTRYQKQCERLDQIASRMKV